MAKKEASGNGKPVNKSQAIRDVFAEAPKADSKTVIARLAEKGVKVSPTMVYYVRSKLGRRSGGRSGSGWPSPPGRPPPGTRSRSCSG